MAGGSLPRRRDRAEPADTVRAARIGTERPNLRPVAELLAERQIPGEPIDIQALTTVASIQRVAMRIRHHLEQGVLRRSELTWTGFLVLWVLWLHGDLQTRHLAEEVGVNRSTLSGVLATLERRGLLVRHAHETEGRLVIVTLTDKGSRLIEELFPRFNAEESFMVSALSADAMRRLGNSLRTIGERLDSEEGRQRRARAPREQ